MLKTSSRHVLKTSLRRLEDQQMFAGYIVKFGQISRIVIVDIQQENVG